MSAIQEIPIFPLSNVVLFPGIHCPLHIFEPRYRQMTEAALESDQCIGMVTVRPDSVSDIQGDPPVFRVGCLGTIVEHQRLSDGRFNLLLLGTQRFAIADELAGPKARLFRVARVEPLAEPAAEDTEHVASLRELVLRDAAELIERNNADQAKRFAQQDFESIEDSVFASTLCSAFPFSPAEKQQLLEASGVTQRLEHLSSLLEFRLAERSGSGSPPSPSVH